MAQEWKLKDLSKLDLNNYDKVEAEVDGIEGGKVVLVKVKDQVHALNANCTHFGAPLKNGVVTPDGRLTCPWHGACFNVATGDVEDAPAPHALNKFDVFEKDGSVYIKGKEADIKGGKRTVNIKTTPQSDEKVVIVGSGSGAFGALLKLRQHGFKGKVTVVTSKTYPIDRTKLSKALITDESKLYLNPPEWYKDGSIDFANETVSGVDFDKKTVKTESGKNIEYTKLILATGGTPKNLPLPGFQDLSNIFVLRDVNNVQDIMNAVGDKGKNIAIVGTSFIGMEVANGLAKENNVSLIGMEDAPLERVMGKQVGQIFQKTLEKNGAKFYMGASVDSAYPSKSNKSAVGGIKLKDGTEIPADLVILGVGVGPATEYLKDNSKIKLEKDGSIAVDESFKVKSLDSVWAIGDIATYPYSGPGGNKTPVRIEHWNVAQNMGRSVGQQIADPSGPKPKPFIPIFWSALGSQLRYCGNTPQGWDDVVLKGEPEEGKFAAYYAKGEEIVAVASMQMDPVMVKCAELMRRGEMLGKKDIEGGRDVLKAGL
ncbi:Apoptosis-inducing factor 1 [Cyphellophora attinorum]|uniref:Apoptosis-inducing factor 1 n=1 Tax=Cyphellophora attinorum TaxID=1664694 RepID=A0A0N1HQ43_9EURO|nr:Apoptosis-inducing factor 1 [Phialophora attinorum]KPI37516.1 Apoptosis-inducing factor 1 [Phialophora attinorum]